MFKQILTPVLGMVLLLAACGSDDKGTGNVTFYIKGESNKKCTIPSDIKKEDIPEELANCSQESSEEASGTADPECTISEEEAQLSEEELNALVEKMIDNPKCATSSVGEATACGPDSGESCGEIPQQ